MTRKAAWSALGLDETFEDIRIVDLEERKTTWSRVHESMRVVHLRLTRAPDGMWIRLFHEERESRIMARRCGFWIDDAEISFDCLLPDVELHHLPDIERSLAYANRRYHELVAEQRASRGARQVDVQAEREELRALRARIVERYTRPGAAPVPAPVAVAAAAATPAPPAATPSTRPATPAAAPAASDVDAELEARRRDLRERFRTALAHQIFPEDPNRGDR